MTALSWTTESVVSRNPTAHIRPHLTTAHLLRQHQQLQQQQKQLYQLGAEDLDPWERVRRQLTILEISDPIKTGKMTAHSLMNPPLVGKGAAIIIFIINIFAPGIGTIIIGLLECHLWTVLVGIFQSLTAVIIVGWVWSILWGYKLYQRSSSHLLGGGQI